MVSNSTIKRPRIGFHAPIKGGLHQALVVAKETGCDTVQIFSRNPRGWQAKPLTPADITLFKKVRRLTKLKPVVIHCNYLVNLAASDDLLLQKSRESFREELERAILLDADYLVVHPGSARGACEADGIRTCADSIKFAVRQLNPGKLRILLENTAGQGECIGHRFEHLREIMDACPKIPLGVCFDTAHAFTAGYDFREEPPPPDKHVRYLRNWLADKFRVTPANAARSVVEQANTQHPSFQQWLRAWSEK